MPDLYNHMLNILCSVKTKNQICAFLSLGKVTFIISCRHQVLSGFFVVFEHNRAIVQVSVALPF